MRFRPSAAPRSVVNRLQVTSMIDVIFLLLIFFMATTTFSQPEAHLTPGLKEQRATGRASDLEPQIVDVTREGDRDVFRLGARVLMDKASLVAALRELPTEPGVFVRVSDEVRVESAAAAVQACRDAGFEKVSYVPAN